MPRRLENKTGDRSLLHDTQDEGKGEICASSASSGFLEQARKILSDYSNAGVLTACLGDGGGCIEVSCDEEGNVFLFWTDDANEALVIEEHGRSISDVEESQIWRTILEVIGQKT